MSREPTKAQLAETVEFQERTIDETAKRLKVAENKIGILEGDVRRHESNWKDAERRLTSIRQVIVAALRVRHDVDLNPETQWVGDRNIPVEETTEEIRLLRHIHELANNEPPF